MDLVTQYRNDKPLAEAIISARVTKITPLCIHCQYICDHWSAEFVNSDLKFKHHKNLLELRQSAADGCSMCAQYLQSGFERDIQRMTDMMSKHGPRNIESLVSCSFIDAERPSDGLALKLKYQASRPGSNTASRINSSQTLPDLQVLLVAASHQRIIRNLDSRSEMSKGYAIPQVSQWLRDCRANHWRCNFDCKIFTPSRLISTEENCVKLVLLEDFNSGSPEYATLSHCWGHNTFVTLTKGNLEAFQKQIPPGALSKTFREAIETARELGFQYIWIDSLCIVQDDDQDWLREAGLMSSVYGNSSLNIAASSAKNGHHGLSFRNEVSLICRLLFHTNQHTVIYQCVPSAMYFKFLSRMPLMMRAWALQERVLASRTVHFTSTQVFWECYHLTSCETFPDGIPTSLRQTIDCFEKQPVSLSMWRWIVQRYSGSLLTYGQDKLVANSGLARSVQMQTRDQYVAGMWREGLEIQLCWYTATRSQNHIRATPYRAPTWSWASLDRIITIPSAWQAGNIGSRPNLWTRVSDVLLQPLGTDPLGKLSAANLRLECTALLKVSISRGTEEDYMFTSGRRISVIIRLDEDIIVEKHDCVALPMFDHFRNSHAHGLLIEPTGSEKGQYRRLGHFLIDRNETYTQFASATQECPFWVDNANFCKTQVD